MFNKIFTGLAIVGLCLNSCSKSPLNIDNSNTIKVPYTLLIGTGLNAIQKTNDGIDYTTLHYPGGSFTQSIYTIDTNIIYINNYINTGCGMHLPNFGAVSELAPTIPILRNLKPQIKSYLNSSLYDKINKRLYVCSANINNVFENDSSGKCQSGDWKISPFNTNANVIRSLAQTKNGDVFGIDFSNNLFRRFVGVGNFSTVTTSGIPNGSGEEWALGAVDDNLIIADMTGNSGIKLSSDFGVTWGTVGNPYPTKKVTMLKTVMYNNEFVVAFDSLGLTKLVGGSLIPFGAGLPKHARIWDIIGKRNVYKTDLAKYYYYLATNMGLFLSEDNMQNWTLIKQGEHTALN